jgi:transcriptional regulator of NAD metabolism
MSLENEKEQHQKQVNEEFATMKFKAVKIQLFPEDETKLKTMSREEKTEFMQKIREEHRYTVVKDD